MVKKSDISSYSHIIELICEIYEKTYPKIKMWLFNNSNYKKNSIVLPSTYVTFYQQ